MNIDPGGRTHGGMDAAAALGVLDLLGRRAWIGGGWGVDALAGRVSRPHADLDLALDAADLDSALAALGAAGFAVVEDWRPVRVEVAHPDGRRVDLHPVRFGPDGSGVQAGLDGTSFRYAADGFGTGRIGGREVDCLTAAQQLRFRVGYVWRPADAHDVALLREVLLADLVRAALGRVVTGVERLTGGSKKGVFRLRLDDGTSVVAYVWAADEDRWTAVRDAESGIFADATGLELFAAAHAALTGAGVRTMRLHLLDREAGVALVEDLPASLEELLAEGRGDAALTGLAGLLDALAGVRSPRCGKVAGPAHAEPFADLVLARALRHLASAATRSPRLAEVADRVAGLLRARAAAVGGRAAYSLVHGELGPDHVRVDAAGRPALVDIEGLMYADAEWEHAFLRLRLHGDYAALDRPGLDPARLAFYRLALEVSLVEGPLRLLDTDVGDREFWRDIAEWNLGLVLAELDD